MAILPPWAMLASMSRKAAALPDISRPTSKPSFMPSCFCTSGERLLRDVHGQRRAHACGQVQAVGIDVGDDDVARPGVAHDGGGHDADGAGAGDQHVLAEHGEATARCGRRCRRDRRWRPRRGRCPGRWRQTLVIGSAMYSAKAPGRLTPTPWVSAHRWRRPARQLRQRPQTTWPSPLTMSPGWKSVTLEPTSTISPTNSWPTTIGTGNGLLRPVVPVVDVHDRCRRCRCVSTG